MNPIKVVQIIPRMDEGGAERGALDLAREHGKTGAATHVIISEGGRLAAEIIKAGARFFPLPVASKNIFTMPFRMLKLYRALSANCARYCACAQPRSGVAAPLCK